MFALSSCSNKYESQTYFALDTFIQTTLPDGYSHDVYEYIQELESQFSKTRAESDVYRLNNSETTVLSDKVLKTVLQAVEISEKTNGAFDVTLGSVTALWEFKSEAPAVPSEQSVKNALEFTGINKISFSKNEVTLENGVMIDLGGIAKGSIAQYCVQYLHDLGVNTGILNFGGNIAIVGPKENGDAWNIALRDPQNASATIGNVSLTSGFISVSGDYERCFEFQDKKYHHIINPGTGYPVDNEICSVMVISDDGTQADALSTALFVMGLQDSYKFYSSNLYDFEAVIVTKDNGIYLTEGAKEVFNLTSVNYEYKNF